MLRLMIVANKRCRDFVAENKWSVNVEKVEVVSPTGNDEGDVYFRDSLR